MKNAKDRKNIEKSGKKSRFELFYPGNLQKEIDSYGYSFSMGKYSLFLAMAAGTAIGCGLLFCLHWYLIVLVALACMAVLPFLILDGYKQMYEHKQFLDVSDYMDQILYSFRLNQKIFLSLKDTRTLFAEGRCARSWEKPLHILNREVMRKIYTGRRWDLWKKHIQPAVFQPFMNIYVPWRATADRAGRELICC